MKILISAGPTLEPIDAVRFISNRSSGRMGVALSEAAARAGHEVCLVHGPLSVPLPEVGERVAVEQAVEMMEELAKRMDWADVLIMSAAVCDMRPIRRDDKKVEKAALHHLDLMANPDIVGVLASSFPKVHVVSFSLENDLSLDRPLAKMRSKKAHWVVVNALDSMGADDSIFAILNREGEAILEATSLNKGLLGQRLVQLLEDHLAPNSEN